MDKVESKQVSSADVSETEKLAKIIGRNLRGGEVIELISDLGGGKTAFVRGLARGMGSKDKVSSPSFTISNEYKADNLVLYHFDFYRLNSPGIISNELAEKITEPNAVIAVEWSDIVKDVLPINRLVVNIAAKAEDTRELTFTYPEKLSYILKGVN
jgi:tRNA threonylcarbamoyladenosine biosynthesis protein TsaE